MGFNDLINIVLVLKDDQRYFDADGVTLTLLIE